MSAYAEFGVIMPDYLGYGESDDVNHPYIIEKSSARVSIDMLKASIEYMEQNNIKFKKDIYISEYSEGGYVAMAMAKELEQSKSMDYNIRGVAPMAGPYDIASLGDETIKANKTMIYPAFLAFLATSYANTYNDISLDNLFNDENISKLNILFNGSYGAIEIHQALGLVSNKGYGFNQHKTNVLLKDSFISDYNDNANNTFKARLQQNNVFDWYPKNKINLIHCQDDEIIPVSMVQTAYNKFIYGTILV